ncbi:MAG: hypothetical protein IJY53_05935, partial [Akkermansia sp.]|nr:hypothetical protein [Akkermansia sp.]
SRTKYTHEYATAATDPNRHAEYFTITEDGVLSLKPEYRGEPAKTTYPDAISDMGVGVAGSQNAELPEHLVIPEVVDIPGIIGEVATARIADGGNEVYKALKAGEQLNCPKCKESLKLPIIYHICPLADAVAELDAGQKLGCEACEQRMELLAHKKQDHSNISDADVMKWAEKGCDICRELKPMAAHRQSGHRNISDDDIVTWAERGCRECQKLKPLAQHRLAGHDSISDADVNEWAEKGCAECKKRLKPPHDSLNHSKLTDTQYAEGIKEGCAKCLLRQHKENHKNLSDKSIVEWADKGCAECKKHKPMAEHRLQGHKGISASDAEKWASKGCKTCNDIRRKHRLNEHMHLDHGKLSAKQRAEGKRLGCDKCKNYTPPPPVPPIGPCPSNAEVKAMMKGSSTYNEVQRHVRKGCPRCIQNFNWWLKQQK